MPLVAIAKGPDRDAGRETFFMAGRDPFKLPPRDPLLYFVERLRDEAHRFAIGSHRARRKKDIREAGLQEIPGIGPTRKRALLQHFGTVKAIERASLPDLSKVPGINAETARKIYEFFHESRGGCMSREAANDHRAARRRHPGGAGGVQEHRGSALARDLISLVKHLHAFARDVHLTEEEFEKAVDMIANSAKRPTTSTTKRC